MPFSAASPDDLRLLLLTLAAASATEPARRARAAGWLRAALALVEEETEPSTRARIAAHRAIEQLAHSLTMASAHADGLLEQSARLMARCPPA